MIHQILKDVADAGIELYCESGKLKARAANGAISADIKARIAAHKTELLRYLQNRGSSTEANQQIDRVMRTAGQYYPASFAQERMWLTDQLAGESHHYNIFGAFEVPENFDVEIAEAAFKAIIQRHEVLRTRVMYRGTEVLQTVEQTWEFAIERLECKHRLNDTGLMNAEEAVHRLLVAHGHHEFDFAQPCMLSVRFIDAPAKRLLSICMPHIVSDGWSEAILIREFIAFYDALSANRVASLPTLDIHYLDYSVWQRQWLASEECEAQRDYWRQQLDGLPLCHSLPLDFERQPHAERRGHTLSKSLDAVQSAKLKACAAEHGITSFMLLHAALTLVLSRFSNADDVVVGTPVSNRVNPQVEPLIGFFVNTLVLRAECDETQTIEAFLDRIRAVNVAAQQHQSIPFSCLVEEIKPDRINGVSPLFQILFTMDTNDQVELLLNGHALIPVTQPDTSAKYDLTISAVEQNQATHIALNYDTALFNETTISRMLDAFVFVIQALTTSNHDVLVRDVPMSSTLARIQHDAEPKPERDYPSLVSKFEQVAESAPQRLAIVDAMSAMTYQQANEKANQIARFLIVKGVKPGDLVGLACERSTDTFLAMLALMKLGAGYVPFQPDAPVARLRHIFSDTQVRFALCGTQSAKHLADLITSVSLDALDSVRVISSVSAADLNVEYDPSTTLCYVIYTSGSTGTPKGVAITQANVAHYVHGLSTHHEVPEGLNYAVLSSIATDLGNTAIFLALATGGTLRIASADTSLNRDKFLSFIEANQVEFMKLTPSHFSALTGDDEGVSRVQSQVRWVVFGGESIPAELRRRLQRLAVRKTCRFINHYGPTETTIGFCTQTLDFDDEGRLPIGRPLGEGNYRLLDRYGRDVPPGVPGELLISGPGVARGYWHNTALTETAFPTLDGCRMYRTGDWVKQLDAGELLFLGRIDHQLKIRGYRIELGEIEQAVASVLALDSVVVRAVRQDPNQEPRLVAYFKRSADMSQATQDTADWRAAMSGSLPSYMIPEAWIPVSEWPLTSNGKIDVQNLPEVSFDAAQSLEPPVDEDEARMQALWAELLNIPPDLIGRNSDFFALGGHSLLAIRLISATSEHYGVKVSIRDLFDHPVLSGFVAGVRSADRVQLGDAPRAVTGENQNLPLSFGQQLIWFIDQMEQGSAHYNMPSVLDLKGKFDPSAAEWALQQIVQRHAILRTTYTQNDGDAMQCIRPLVEFTLKVEDVSALESVAREQAIQALIAQDATAPFNLATDLPVRALFIRTASEQGKLLFNMHHIASDGWSMRLLVSEFRDHYNARVAGRAHSLPPLPLQYADFAVWQKDRRQSDAFEQQLAYWEHQLAELPASHTLPMRGPRPTKRSYSGAGVSSLLDQSVVDKLKQLARHHSSTFFMVLHAGFTLLLSRYGHSEDIVVGTPVANRTHSSLENLIGFFVNTLVLRTRPERAMTFVQLLAHVREVNLAAQANQEVPFEMLVERINPLRSVQTSPLFQILFTLDEVVGEPVTLEGVTLTPEFHAESVSKFELTVDATAVEQGYFFNFQFNTDIFEPELVQRMAADFMRLLTRIAEQPESRIGAISQLTGAIENRALQQFSSTPAALDSDDLYFDEYVSRYAKSTPNQIAIVDADTQLSYATLDDRANQLANYLIAQGLETGDVTAVLLPRSADLIVAMLAIMRAGGVYLATDISAPRERNTQILEQSGARWVLSGNLGSTLISDLDIKLVNLDAPTMSAALADTSPTPVTRKRNEPAEQVAYLIFTSGSTGQPKGVAISHSALASYSHATRSLYRVHATDRVLQFSSTAFDIFFEELSMAFAAGASLVFRSDEMVAGGTHFWHQLGAAQISVMTLPTSFWQQLVSELGDDADMSLGSLHTIVLGGERLSNTLVARWRAVAGNEVRVINTYGPTEATIIASAYSISDQTDLQQPIPIGQNLGNSELLVLAPDQSVSPEGCVGELYIGGKGLALGYWQDEARSQQAFIEDLPCIPGQRYYKSGDLVRLIDNQLHFVGRSDNQVKLGGYRVELGEIERHLLQLPEVARAKVLAPIVKGSQRHLCAYLELEATRQATDLTVDDVQQALRKRLPNYMVPEFVWVLTQLPLTINGKIDITRLPTVAETNQRKEVVQPRNEIEAQLRDVWADLLGLSAEQISIEDDFFQLGGNSMLSIRLMLAVNSVFPGQVSIHDIFSHTGLAAMAQCVTGNVPLNSSILTRLTSGPDASPKLFCVPGALGTAAVFHAVSRQLSGYDVYAFNHSGVLDEQAPHTAIEHMVDTYLSELLNVQSNGEFVLIGHSLGAKVAYEMTRVLESLGHKVRLIVLDSAFKWREAVEEGIPTLPISSNVDDELAAQGQKVKQAMADFLLASVVSTDARSQLVEKLDQLYELHARMSKAHVIDGGLSADVLLVYAEETVISPLTQPGRFTDGHMFTETVPGEHDSMLTGANALHCAQVIGRFLSTSSESISEKKIA